MVIIQLITIVVNKDELVTKAMKSNKKDERANYLFEAERLLAKEVPHCTSISRNSSSYC